MRLGLRQAWATTALVGAALAAGCGQAPGTANPPDGVLTLEITPADTTVASLQLSSATLRVENVSVFGDTAPDSRSMLSNANIDLLSAGSRFTFTMLPEGVYSRVRFALERVELQGTWRGTPLQAQLEAEDDGGANVVDLRSAGAELAPGHDVTLSVSLDVGSWFAGALLDQAVASSGSIRIDEYDNTTVGQTLVSRVLGSFSLADPPVQ